MGIQGLLPMLSKIYEPIHLADLKGLAVAVDTYVWLHRGAFGCAQDLVLGNPTTKYVGFVMRKVELLRQHGIHPVMVFDGGPLPIKAGTEEQRRKRRHETREKAIALLKAGKKSEAESCFQTCVDVTPRMAWEVIKELKKANVEYIVAPYEADAQLAFLSRTKHVAAIITEDSDLVVFGCERVVLKLDATGSGIQIRNSRLNEVFPRFWSQEKIRHMCILSGCDYIDSLPGMGLKTALKKMSKFETAYQFMKNTRNLGPVLSKMTIPKDYEESFRRADYTFLYQRVFDPESRGLVPLNPFPADLEEHLVDADFIGPNMTVEIARAIADAEVDPISRRYFESGLEIVTQPLVPRNSSMIRKPSHPANSGKENKEEPVTILSSQPGDRISDPVDSSKKRTLVADPLNEKPRKLLILDSRRVVPASTTVNGKETWSRHFPFFDVNMPLNGPYMGSDLEEKNSAGDHVSSNDKKDDAAGGGNERDIFSRPFMWSRSDTAGGRATPVAAPIPSSSVHPTPIRVANEIKRPFIFKKPVSTPPAAFPPPSKKGDVKPIPVKRSSGAGHAIFQSVLEKFKKPATSNDPFSINV
ncbi:hypothetical protein SmJEL517_g02617 [Synchytrium microbalum]|uniref:Exonuclease 1 n=1 Tax=Synchytrium microbalum TaxID=1806994 RepID=A0A507CBC3_9FUNG|nr:uncharacterized protein SmJEL517_g02617 [Synchytrium microbalum]TPX34845.1 hypothetical protein SmJEL517_g02617 [Synchytrium microbalum]